MEVSLNGKRVAILVENGFEQSELEGPKKALEEAGARTEIVSPVEGQVRGWKNKEWSNLFFVDTHLQDASSENYDALLLPGGVMNPDKLRMNPVAVEFVTSFWDQGK